MLILKTYFAKSGDIMEKDEAKKKRKPLDREFSCGAVLFTKRNGNTEYVLIMEPNGSYGFPKGHRRSKETNIDCALREIKEETGIDAEILPGFKRTIKYKVFNKSIKEVTYFLATFNEDEQSLNPLDNHILQARSYPIEAAKELLKFQQLRDILVEADFILSHKK